VSGQSYSSGRGRHISDHASVDVGIVHDPAASDVRAAGLELWFHESHDIRTGSEERRLITVPVSAMVCSSTSAA